MTQNAWNSDVLNANGEVLIGNGTSRPTSSTLTAGSNCSITNAANSITINNSGGGGGGDFVLIDSFSASGSITSIDFTDLTSTYFMYLLVVDNFTDPAGFGNLAIRTSTDNGSTFDNGSTDYFWTGWQLNSGGSISACKGIETSYAVCVNTVGNGTNDTGSAYLWIFNPSASDYTRMYGKGGAVSSGSLIGDSWLEGRAQSTAVDAIRLVTFGTEIATAEVRLYGVKAA